MFLSEVPAAPDYNPAHITGMPASTGVLANPVRYRHKVACNGTLLELQIRSFGIRGCLFEEDIVTRAVDALRVVFVGLFGRFPTSTERKSFASLLAREFEQALTRVLPRVKAFMKKFPNAGPQLVMQYLAVMRKSESGDSPVNARRVPAELLREMIRVHMENVAAGVCSSYLRRGPFRRIAGDTPFETIFSFLLRRKVNTVEAGILEPLGTIQIHHGSAGSNMVARYLASLHTRSVSDIFTAAQMTLDCARHFGAITDVTDFVNKLENLRPARQDQLIRLRLMQGNLPTFGHPEIAAAGRELSLEFDPRPAIYLSPLFAAIDAGSLKLSPRSLKRVAILQRMYQLAFVEGIEKPGRDGRLRVAPNTDFGAWIVEEALGIDEADRTLLTYVFRGFGWMMDVREQLQQPIIRPVIAPDPLIVPPPAEDGVISNIVDAVHRRLANVVAGFRPRANAG